MSKGKESKNKNTCVHLDEQQLERLAKLIISQTERKFRQGTARKEMMTAPSGAVVIF